MCLAMNTQTRELILYFCSEVEAHSRDIENWIHLKQIFRLLLKCLQELNQYGELSQELEEKVKKMLVFPPWE